MVSGSASRKNRTPPLVIRKLSAGDSEYAKTLEEIAEIASSIFPEPVQFEDLARELLSHEDSGVYAAKDIRNNNLVGFDVWYKNPEDKQVWLWLHGVVPEYRKRGIGRKIMRYCLTDLELLGYNKVTLITYNGFPEMIRLCRRMGFVKIKKDTQDNWGKNNTCSYYYQKTLVPAIKDGQLKIEQIIEDKKTKSNKQSDYPNITYVPPQEI